MKALLTSLVDSSKLGGWVRALVASGLTMAIAKVPHLKDILDPSTQAALGVVVSGIVVGLWSQYVKGTT
jgi:hypothetical protein